MSIAVYVHRCRPTLAIALSIGGTVGGDFEARPSLVGFGLRSAFPDSISVTILDTDVTSTFTLVPEQMFFAESGSLHGSENLGSTEAELMVGFGHETPSDVSLRATFGSQSGAVLGHTFGLPIAALAPIARDTFAPYLVRGLPQTLPETARFADLRRFDLGAQQPPIDFRHGTLAPRVGRDPLIFAELNPADPA